MYAHLIAVRNESMTRDIEEMDILPSTARRSSLTHLPCDQQRTSISKATRANDGQPIRTSIFDLYKIGPGPSSSHTIGPMKICNDFLKTVKTEMVQSMLEEEKSLKWDLRIHLYGSLSATGLGHGTHTAVIGGLLGWEPKTCDPHALLALFKESNATYQFPVPELGDLQIGADNIIWHDPSNCKNLYHPNTLRLEMIGTGGSLAKGDVLFEREYYSVGGGFIEKKGCVSEDSIRPDPDYPFSHYRDVLDHVLRHNFDVVEMVIQNEIKLTGKSRNTTYQNVAEIINVMDQSVERGLAAEGVLPGPIRLKRKAKAVYESARKFPDQNAIAYLNAYAMAASEENAAGMVVVTAPTSGSAGVIPGLLYFMKYHWNIDEEMRQKSLICACLIGFLVKHNASISGAEMGCMGEIGVASAMGAAALAYAQCGGLHDKYKLHKVIEASAEIALEHHLGMTCDPIGGYVQIPCIQRNSMGAVKAYNAYLLATASDPSDQKISLDDIIDTMKRTAGNMVNCWETTESQMLESAAPIYRSGKTHLRELLKKDARNDMLFLSSEGITLDATRSLLDEDELKTLRSMYTAMAVDSKISDMFSGQKINKTENRAVGHVALRDGVKSFKVDGQEYMDQVHKTRRRMYDFAYRVRSGQFIGHTGQPLTDIVCIGIGGSYLGIEFIHEAFRTYEPATEAARGRRIRFLANVDPIDVKRALEGLCPQTTLAVVLSKTFTTAETMLNARTVRDWFLKHFNGDTTSLTKHMCAVSTNLDATSKFGISSDNVFGFWDWVGGRFSVCSAVGVLPLALQYGESVVEEFLAGCKAIDEHVYNYRSEPMQSIPAMMALISFYNASYLNYSSVAVLPYCQALTRFAAHIQQVTMESNGKRVTMDGKQLPDERFSGEVYFGEPGTNGQHSFYQLIHQGRVVPCEFIGFSKSQHPIELEESSVSSHDELMSNFFAQPDALALGKTVHQLQAENVSAELIPHKEFPGNRPSMCLLFDGCLTPLAVGKLLSIYEHRVAIEGFLWNVNSFDQFGVELGKVLAKSVRSIMKQSRAANNKVTGADDLLKPTSRLLEKYFS